MFTGIVYDLNNDYAEPNLSTATIVATDALCQLVQSVLTVFKPRSPRTENALRLRALLDTYNQEVADLPREVREFLESAEADHG